MSVYALFLAAMSALFMVSAAVLLLVALAQVRRRRPQQAVVYLGLTLLASGVAAGFYFFRSLI